VLSVDLFTNEAADAHVVVGETETHAERGRAGAGACQIRMPSTVGEREQASCDSHMLIWNDWFSLCTISLVPRPFRKRTDLRMRGGRVFAEGSGNQTNALYTYTWTGDP